MEKKRPKEVPPEARHTLAGLERWLEGRRSRNIPEWGAPLARLHTCDESCTLHDSDAIINVSHLNDTKGQPQ
jgi:hypothetical protein